MMQWLMQNPFIILATGVFFSVILAVLWYHTKDRRWLNASVAVGGLALLLLVVERWVETDQEQLRRTIREMAQVVENNQVQKLLTYISPEAIQTRAAAEGEMPGYVFKSCNVTQIHKIDVQQEGERKTAEVTFIVSVWVTAPQYQIHEPNLVLRKVILNFEKTDAKVWMVTQYRHLDPINPDMSPVDSKQFTADF